MKPDGPIKQLGEGKTARIFNDRNGLFSELAGELLSLMQERTRQGHPVRLVLGGGRTPVELNRVVVSLAPEYDIDWEKVFIFFSDERCVPPDHDASNFKMIHETFSKPLRIPEINVAGIQGELPPAEAAKAYEEKIRANINGNHQPLFDLSLLGLGPDGHTASLFPGTSALLEHEKLAVCAGKGPEGFDRITLTIPALNSSKNIWFLISGEEKKQAFDGLMSNSSTINELPAAGIMPHNGSLIYFANF